MPVKAVEKQLSAAGGAICEVSHADAYSVDFFA